MNIKLKSNWIAICVAALSLVMAGGALAQSDLPKAEQEAGSLPEGEEPVSLSDQSGLEVKEWRSQDRLDGVSVKHKSGLEDYYDLNDPDLKRREGGLLEGGAMRTWRLGGGKK